MNIDQFLEDIKAVVRDGQELLRLGLGSVKDRTRFGVEKTSQYVREKPYHTIGVAFGLGLLLGVVVAGMLKGEEQEEEY